MATRNAKRAGAKTGATAETAAPEAPSHNAADGDQTRVPETATIAPGGDSVTGDGTGKALPPVDPDAGQRIAEGVNTESSGDSDEPLDEIPGLFIRTARGVESRRRGGFRFNREGYGIARSALSDDQIAAFRRDPALIVEDALFPAEADD